MINPKILVTGATGRTGRVVVTQLLAKGWPVRAAVRVRDARSDLLQCRGAEVVVADIFDPGQLMDAMRGVQRACYCPPLSSLRDPECGGICSRCAGNRSPQADAQRI
jgi:NAD(P)H dehydrogenase (quinone)